MEPNTTDDKLQGFIDDCDYYIEVTVNSNVTGCKGTKMMFFKQEEVKDNFDLISRKCGDLGRNSAGFFYGEVFGHGA